MVANQRIMQREDFVEILRELKNITPTDIKQLEEAHRKESALTDAELEKNKEARDYIAKYDLLLIEIKKREDSLLKEKLEHEKNADEFKSKSDKEFFRLQEWETKLNNVSARHLESFNLCAEKESRLIEDRQKLENDIVSAQNLQRDRILKLEARELAVLDGERKNAKEAERINALENKLKIKAQRLAAEAAS